jgi:hypothetical protein
VAGGQQLAAGAELWHHLSHQPQQPALTASASPTNVIHIHLAVIALSPLST